MARSLSQRTYHTVVVRALDDEDARARAEAEVVKSYRDSAKILDLEQKDESTWQAYVRLTHRVH